VSPPRRRRSSGRSNASRSQSRRRKAPGRDFWGTAQPEAHEEIEGDPIRPIDDPTVLVRSLGAPPLPGHETAAEHYFAAVYDRAANLAVALAAASDLLATDEADG
jgi:hypothetical protein